MQEKEKDMTTDIKGMWPPVARPKFSVLESDHKATKQNIHIQIKTVIK